MYVVQVTLKMINRPEIWHQITMLYLVLKRVNLHDPQRRKTNKLSSKLNNSTPQDHYSILEDFAVSSLSDRFSEIFCVDSPLTATNVQAFTYIMISFSSPSMYEITWTNLIIIIWNYLHNEWSHSQKYALWCFF